MPHIMRLWRCLLLADAMKEWEEIIPAHMRQKVDEEERLQQLLHLNLPPRNRKTVRQVWCAALPSVTCLHCMIWWHMRRSPMRLKDGLVGG